MIAVLSYIIAFILTLIIAICLYPIAAMFWFCGIVGKFLSLVFNALDIASDSMFKFTSVFIGKIWRELLGSGYGGNA